MFAQPSRATHTESGLMIRCQHGFARRAGVLVMALLTLIMSSTYTQAQERLRITGTGSGTGGMTLLAEAFMRTHPEVRIDVLPAFGSTGGIRALMARKIDLAVANREPKQKEHARMPMKVYTYARTPMVIAVHRNLGISALTSDELAELYGDDVPTYANGRRARPVLRKSDSTDTRIVRSISPAVDRAVDFATGRRGMLDGTTDSNTADLLENIPGAFGPSTLALIESESRPLVALSIDGVAPTLENLANGQWKFQKPLIMVMQENPIPSVQQFVEFVQSAEGRRIMTAAGHGQP